MSTALMVKQYPNIFAYVFSITIGSNLGSISSFNDLMNKLSFIRYSPWYKNFFSVLSEMCIAEKEGKKIEDFNLEYVGVIERYHNYATNRVVSTKFQYKEKESGFILETNFQLLGEFKDYIAPKGAIKNKKYVC